MPLFDVTFDSIGLALGAASKRQEVLANNIANVNTPGYKRQDVTFEDTLARALDESATRSGSAASDDALDGVTYTVETQGDTSMRTDGNNVDIDHEMALLGENNVRYNALIQMATKKIETMKYVISDGRR